MERVAITGRGGQIKNPDKETKARKECEGGSEGGGGVEGPTGAKHISEEALCHNYTDS